MTTIKIDPSWDTPRQLVARGLNEKHLSLAEASRRLKRNSAYLQQYLKRGTPAELDEDEREQLARMVDLHPDDFRKAPPAGEEPGRGPIKRDMLEYAIIATLTAIINDGRSLDAIPPRGLARTILATYDAMMRDVG
ncbi:MAG: hypothetical protein HQL41_17225 [Alphaproteobacteria bacterium]|nr:hypothetical protein [Alphaproteobacteria bacterium]